ncbi:hypothetical protein [Staphylococcus lugdunensis]|uniref:Purine repressor n=1 Tax=Staphylococcus phage HS06 TaxID=3056400 RepID=A0AA49X2B6_9VIRU|nr:hypothetical protein [Staphylococcus lugdunensis]MCI2758952.1 hypothetical protein [Staphylococcus lugdunensis]MCI2794050.1 hypothetical protein [Staphylococcus lugdunensis]MCI2796616.1 hypothetical protein [Staphylococcus lugdunensis]WLJ25707.1 MAG: purine repressor [Staphylococcus phage HS06]
MIKNHLDAKELSQILPISKSTATNIIRKLNQQLEEEGYIAIRGKIPIQMLEEKFPHVDFSESTLKELEESK